MYIAPEMWITPVEAISILAALSGYSFHNGDAYNELPEDENDVIFPIEEEDDDWSEDWPFLDLY